MKQKNQLGIRKSEAGFSYIDVIIAIMVCSIGVLAMTAALTTNLIRSHGMTNQIMAKQIATSTLESVFTAREVSKTTNGVTVVGGLLDGWDSVGNVGSNPVDGVPKGVFLTGWNPVREKNGPDGVAGTADDACPAISTCPGETGTNPVASGFERTITITDLNDVAFDRIRKRRIDVSVRYRLSNMVFTENISSIICDYR